MTTERAVRRSARWRETGGAESEMGMDAKQDARSRQARLEEEMDQRGMDAYRHARARLKGERHEEAET